MQVKFTNIRYNDDIDVHNIGIDNVENIPEQIKDICPYSNIKINNTNTIELDLQDKKLNEISIINIRSYEEIDKSYIKEIDEIKINYNSGLINMKDLIQNIVDLIDRYTIKSSYLCHYISSSNEHIHVYIIMDAYSNIGFRFNIYSNHNQNQITNIFQSYIVNNCHDMNNAINICRNIWFESIKKPYATLFEKKQHGIQNYKEYSLHIPFKDLKYEFGCNNIKKILYLSDEIKETKYMLSKGKHFYIYLDINDTHNTRINFDCNLDLNIYSGEFKTRFQRSHLTSVGLYSCIYKSKYFNKLSLGIDYGMSKYIYKTMIGCVLGMDLSFAMGNNKISIKNWINKYIGNIIPFSINYFVPTPYFKICSSHINNNIKFKACLGYNKQCFIRNFMVVDTMSRTPAYAYISFEYLKKIQILNKSVQAPKLLFCIKKSINNSEINTVGMTNHTVNISMQLKYEYVDLKIGTFVCSNQISVQEPETQRQTYATLSFGIINSKKMKTRLYVNLCLKTDYNNNIGFNIGISANKI